MPLRSARTVRPAVAAAALLLTLGAIAGTACSPKSSGDACGTRTCSRDSDCGFGQACGQGTCFRRHTFCATDSISMNDRGEWTDCERYRCDLGTGACLTEAQSSNDCVHGALWEQSSLTCVCPVGQGCGGSASPPPAYDLSCYKTCSQDSDCPGGRMCWTPWQGAARCVPIDNYCAWTSDGAVSIWPDSTPDGTGNLPRDTVNCGAYGCDPTGGSCLDHCYTSGDCQHGTSCNLCDPVNGCAPGVAPQTCT